MALSFKFFVMNLKSLLSNSVYDDKLILEEVYGTFPLLSQRFACNKKHVIINQLQHGSLIFNIS